MTSSRILNEMIKFIKSKISEENEIREMKIKKVLDNKKISYDEIGHIDRFMDGSVGVNYTNDDVDFYIKIYAIELNKVVEEVLSEYDKWESMI